MGDSPVILQIFIYRIFQLLNRSFKKQKCLVQEVTIELLRFFHQTAIYFRPNTLKKQSKKVPQPLEFAVKKSSYLEWRKRPSLNFKMIAQCRKFASSIVML